MYWINKWFEKKSKWIAISAYSWGNTDFVVMARIGKKTGMLYFKVQQIGGVLNNSNIFEDKEIFDVKETLKSLIVQKDKHNDKCDGV